MPEKFTPLPYQLRPIEWLKERAAAALFLSPGLGKTPISLTALHDLMMDGVSNGALVVAPIRVCKITWPNQIAQWNHTKWMKIADMATEEGQKRWENGDFDIALINSERLATISQRRKCKVCEGKGCEPEPAPCRCKGKGCIRCEDGVTCRHGYVGHRYPQFVEKFLKGQKEIPVDTLIIDELSLAKNHAGTRFKALRNFGGLFQRRWGLTGTPAPNGYIDLFNQIRMLDDGKRLGPSVEGFRQSYFTADYMGFKYELNPGAKDRIDSRLADLALTMLGEDYLDLPTCNKEDIHIELPAAARKAYKQLEKELFVLLDSGEITALSAASLANKLLQITGGLAYDADRKVHEIHDEKLKAFEKLRKKHKGEPILVLTAYQHEMERFLKRFPDAKKFHEKDLGDWQKGKIKTWVANPRSLSHGIDGIQKGGRIAVWMTPTWSNETEIQTNARLVRKGQSAETLIYRILCKLTVDDAVVEATRGKANEERSLMTALKGLQKLAKERNI